jgi:cell division protein FtsB
MTLPFKLSRCWHLYILAAFILLVSGYTVLGERGALLLWRLGADKAKLDEQNFRLQKENEALRQRMTRLRYDDYYLEKLAREELSLVRPGEIIYRFSSPDSKNNKTKTLSELPVEPRPSVQQKARR